MADYVIGDVHGCFDTLCRLLEKIAYSPERDRIFMTGDLVNSGPQPAEVVRWAKEEGASVVLGNHDLHLLAVAAGVRAPRKKDRFYDLLDAPDSAELLEWLRTRPLVIREKDFLLVHAGVLPEWDLETIERLAEEVQHELRGPRSAEFLREMYGDEPRRWREDLTGIDRLRITVNAMTRLRMLKDGNEIDFEHKKPPKPASKDLQPWFEVPSRRSRDTLIFFGHWAALGFYEGNGVIGLDSGCIWGRQLTAWRVDDGQIFQVPSEMQ
ncbi:MAG TPA: symmetrical bis(5'-nucleosyl)-tetraphosphatase [Opitutales bacterium]|nr:symmetrical bis(5'-nucleosyl)-tetraphosphatase [Opitutales bacterium]